jgi:hypothetical protein
MNKKYLTEVSFEDFVQNVGIEIVQSEFDDANYQLALAAKVKEETFKEAMKIVLLDGRWGVIEEDSSISLSEAKEIIEKAYKNFQPKKEEFEFFSSSVNSWQEDELGYLLPNACIRQRTIVEKIYEEYRQIYGSNP